MPRADRKHKLLNTWGFDCACHLCTQPEIFSNASDYRLRLIEDLEEELSDRTPQSKATPALAELYVSLHDQEGLLGPIADAYTYAALEYSGVGDLFMAQKYATLSIEAGLLYGGPESSDVLAIADLLQNPRAHWSWLFRQRNHVVDFTS